MAQRYGFDDFTGSAGWLNRFCKRFNIRCALLHGEKKSADSQAASKFLIDIKELISKFKPENVYNSDETAVFYKMTHNKTYLIKGNSNSGFKVEKQRVTVLLGANMDGSDKVKLLVIGKSLNPRCFFHFKWHWKTESNKSQFAC